MKATVTHYTISDELTSTAKKKPYTLKMVCSKKDTVDQV